MPININHFYWSNDYEMSSYLEVQKIWIQSTDAEGIGQANFHLCPLRIFSWDWEVNWQKLINRRKANLVPDVEGQLSCAIVYKGLELPWILVFGGVLEPIPLRYRGIYLYKYTQIYINFMLHRSPHKEWRHKERQNLHDFL